MPLTNHLFFFGPSFLGVVIVGGGGIPLNFPWFSITSSASSDPGASVLWQPFHQKFLQFFGLKRFKISKVEGFKEIQNPQNDPNIWSCWWFQPIWRKYKQNRNLPQIGVKIKNIWNHHLVMAVFDPPKLISLRISRDLKSLVGTGDPKTNRSSESNPSMGESNDS